MAQHNKHSLKVPNIKHCWDCHFILQHKSPQVSSTCLVNLNVPYIFANPRVCNSLKSFSLGMTGNENAFVVFSDNNNALCQMLSGSSAQ
jgi:hypothetical protein